MCGIAGLIGPRIDRDAPAHVSAFLRRLRHRGPDDAGWHAFGPWGERAGTTPDAVAGATVVLAHTRLSILDLSSAGHQPMRATAGRQVVAFNGEIYNFVELRAELAAAGEQFRSHTDTEVLLAGWRRWGAALLPRLTGMFAFALVDPDAGTVTLARDPFGIKPLYYVRYRDGLAFCSEIPPLLDLPGVSRAVDAQRCLDYLRAGQTDAGEATLFAAVRQVPAAHALAVDVATGEARRPERYWAPDLTRRETCGPAVAAERLRALFVDSVRLHLRADVPVGTALSGGIDSSAIVCAVRHVAPDADLHAFSFVADDPALSEERWVDLVGTHVRATVHKVRLSAGDLVADLERLIDGQGEPFGSTSIYAQYRVFRLAREHGVPVMLDGQGADELFAGYLPYLGARAASLLRRGRLWRLRRLLRGAAATPGGSARAVLVGAAGELLPRPLRALARRAVGRDLVPAWLDGGWFRARGVAAPSASPVRLADHLRAVLVDSVTRSSLPQLLRYEDRNSMAWSVESRVPFLTTALAEFVLALPEDFIIDPDATRKAVLRAALRGLVPDPILDRRDKIGFATPERAWLEALGPWVDDVLARAAAISLPVLDHAAVRAEWSAVRNGTRPFDFRVWRWVNLATWAERFGVEFE